MAAAPPALRLLTGTVGDWIVCISVSAADGETLKLIKGWRRPSPPKQLVTGRNPAGSAEASCRGEAVTGGAAAA